MLRLRNVTGAVTAAILLLSAGMAAALPDSLVVGVPAPVGACQVQFPITVWTDSTINYAQFVLDYDSSCLTFVDADLGADATPVAMGMTTGWQISVTSVDDGTNFRIDNSGSADMHVLVQIVSNDPTVTMSGAAQEALLLTFDVEPSSPPCNLLWDDSINSATGTYPTNLVTFANGGSILRSPDLKMTSDNAAGFCLEIVGDVHYWNPAVPAFRTDTDEDVEICGAQTNLPGSPICDTADAAGDYLLRGFGPTGSGMPALGMVHVTATKPTVPARDYPSISGLDAVMCFQDAAGLDPFSPDEERACDVTQNTVTDFTDCIALSQFLAFISSTSNHTGEWVFNMRHLTATGGPVEEENDRDFSIGTGMTIVNPESIDVRTFLLGDCSGHWPVPLKMSAPSQVALSFADVERDGNDLLVRLMANVENEALQTLIYSLDYDANELEYIGSENGERTGDFFMIDNPMQIGVVHGVSIGWKQSLEQSGEVLRLRFRARQATLYSSLSFSRFKVNDLDGNAPVLNLSRDVSTAAPLPTRYALSINPNPFNPMTRIEYTIPEAAGMVEVSLRVYDISGRNVRTLVQGRQGPGHYPVVWNGRDDRDQQLASGVYFVRVNAGSWSTVEKISLLK